MHLRKLLRHKGIPLRPHLPMENSLLVIIDCSSGTTDSLRLTLDSIVDQLYCSIALSSCSQEILEYIKGYPILYHREDPFLPAISSYTDIVSSFHTIIHCSSGIVLRSNCISYLLSKLTEYDSSILTATGYRIFPHYKLVQPSNSLTNGYQYKYYDYLSTDRAVHIFLPDLCVMTTDIILKLSSQCNEERSHFIELGNIWLSFLIGHHLNGCVWKVEVPREMADFAGIVCRSNDIVPINAPRELFDEFYSHCVVKGEWPPGVTLPIYDKSPSPKGVEFPISDLKVIESRCAIWERGFGGVNMSSEPASLLDFAAISSLGVKVIRCGAVADAMDLNYLIDGRSESFEDDSKHFLKVLPRLRKSIEGAAQYGLKTIVTMADLPGAPFHCCHGNIAEYEFWTSCTVRVRAAKFWGLVAKGLKDLSPHVMGYDLINEPYTPVDGGYFDDIPLDYTEELHHFYSQSLKEIRLHDTDVVVILSSLGYANPHGMNTLRCYDDSNVAYSFHMYAAPSLTLPRTTCDTPCYSYPGTVERWKGCPYDMVDITRDFLYKLLKEHVHGWQVMNNVPSNRILVGEFGITREVKGAENYLRDLLEIFDEFGWSWLLYSFRDEEWDALDYELGPNLGNMLNRSMTTLFQTVAKHFH